MWEKENILLLLDRSVLISVGNLRNTIISHSVFCKLMKNPDSTSDTSTKLNWLGVSKRYLYLATKLNMYKVHTYVNYSWYK